MAGAVERMRAEVAARDPAAITDRFLVKWMAAAPVAELMVRIRSDRQFGRAMTLASGGVLVKLVSDAATLLLPAGRGEIAAALGRLRVARQMDGFRGRTAADRGAVVDASERLAAYALAHPEVAEVEINPLFVLPEGVVAVDVLMRVVAAAGSPRQCGPGGTVAG